MSALQLWLQNHNRKLTQDAIDEALMEYIAHVEKQRDELLADKMRLDFLDGNMRFKMGWYVGAAPVGNLLISSVIQPSGKITSIREAIDAAIDRIKGSAA